MTKPASIGIETFETNYVDDQMIVDRVSEHFDLSPYGIINDLGLLNQTYRPTAAFGFFGRSEVGLTCEQLDKVDLLKSEAGF